MCVCVAREIKNVQTSVALSCYVCEQKGRPKADKASEASKPTVIVWEMVMYTVSGWEMGK